MACLGITWGVGCVAFIASSALRAQSTTTSDTAPPVGGSALGIDTTPKTYDELNSSYSSGVTDNVNNAQTAFNDTSEPGVTGQDPYKRDANGNILLDASGNPVMKTQAELDAEVARAEANAGTVTALPSNGQTAETPNFNVDAATVQNPGETTETYGATSAFADQFASAGGIEGFSVAGNAWTSLPHTSGLTVTNDSASVDPAAVASLADGLAAVTGGGATIPGAIGDPGNPVIVTTPPVCKCCGAELHNETVSERGPAIITSVYYAVVWCTLCTYEPSHPNGVKWDTVVAMMPLGGDAVLDYTPTVAVNGWINAPEFGVSPVAFWGWHKVGTIPQGTAVSLSEGPEIPASLTAQGEAYLEANRGVRGESLEWGLCDTTGPVEVSKIKVTGEAHKILTHIEKVCANGHWQSKACSSGAK